MDFNDEDGPIWPMRVYEGGGLYGFCPGKSTWDSRAIAIYQSLVVCHQTGAHWIEGGISDQPSWWIDLVADFLPRMDDQRFYSRARAILGEGNKGASHGNNNRSARNQNRSNGKGIR